MRRSRADVFGSDAGGELQFVDADGAEVLAIEPNLLVLVALEVQNFGGEQLEGAKQFAAAVEKQGGVGAGELDEDFRMLPLAVLGHGGIDGDAVFEFEAAVRDDGLEEFSDLLGGGYFVGNWHKSVLCSQVPVLSKIRRLYGADFSDG
jgi:hypothetical protein